MEGSYYATVKSGFLEVQRGPTMADTSAMGAINRPLRIR
jgi:hypothetical protein